MQPATKNDVLTTLWLTPYQFKGDKGIRMRPSRHRSIHMNLISKIMISNSNGNNENITVKTAACVCVGGWKGVGVNT